MDAIKVKELLQFKLVNIAALRKQRGISITELHRLTGITRQTLYTWEDETAVFDNLDSKIARLALALGCHWKDLVEVIDVPESES